MEKDKRKELYTKYFLQAMQHHKLKKGEIIKQCTDDSLGVRYFNPRWCASNTGQVYSIRKDGLKPLIPYRCGDRLHELQIINTYHGSRLKVYTTRLTAVYFADRSLMETDEEHPITKDMTPETAGNIFSRYWECHHITPRDESNPLASDNSADNLQILSKKQHAHLTLLQRMQSELFKPLNLPQARNVSLEVDLSQVHVEMQRIVNLPKNVPEEFAWDIVGACINQGIPPLQKLRQLFPAIKIQTQYVRLMDCPALLSQFSGNLSPNPTPIENK